MKVVIATPLYPPEIGGPATDASTLVTELTRQGIESALVPFSLVRGYPKVFRHIKYFFTLISLGRNASCVVAFDTVSVGVPATVFARFLRIPLIVRVPGDYAWEQGTQRFGVTDDFDSFQKKKYPGQVQILRALQKFTVYHAKTVLAPSDYFVRVVEGWGVPKERIQRTYLGIVLPKTQSQERQKRQLVSSGRLVSWKGFPLIIDLLVRLPQWRATIIGDGPMRETLERYAKEKQVDNRLTFTGAVSREQVEEHLQKGSAFVLNTSWESFSFQILEAMASGIPTITTNAGSLPELIRDGVDGVACVPNDLDAFCAGVQSIEDEPEVWESRTASAQERAQAFSQEKAAHVFITAIKNVCA